MIKAKPKAKGVVAKFDHSEQLECCDCPFCGKKFIAKWAGHNYVKVRERCSHFVGLKKGPDGAIVTFYGVES